MYELDFNIPAHVHFIGIGGISMSAIARILMNAGFTVSGSDKNENDLTKDLVSAGADIKYPQQASNIPEDCDMVVYTAAIHEDNPEYAEAVRRGIPMFTRASVLGRIMQNYRHSVAVAGTHGKTSTTGMAAEILIAADRDPTVSIGGVLPSIGGNLRVGGNDVFVAEACEYTNSFLQLFPTVGIILNVEEDHMDFFKDIQDIRCSFRKFAELLPADGLLVINSAIEDHSYFTDGLKARSVTFGTDEDADYRTCDTVYDENGCPSFRLFNKGKCLGEFKLNVPGEHNVSNAAAACAMAFEMGVSAEVIKKGLWSFTGSDRRFQKKGELNGALLVDDYAHHPTEIKAVLTAAAKVPHKKLWCVFQPHTYSRTAAFLDEFAEALCLADEVVLAEIFAARETNTFGISSADLSEKIKSLGKNSVFFPKFGMIEDYLLERVGPGDLVFTMGAGDVYKIGEHCLERIR